jgi:hypothetical protein
MTYTPPKNLPIPKLVPLPHASYQTEKEKRKEGRRQRAEGRGEECERGFNPAQFLATKSEIMVGDSDPCSLWSRAEGENSIPSASCLLPSAFLVEAWITKFVYSFRAGSFRSILETARFLRRTSGVWQANSLKVVSGLAVVITCDTWSDYKQLVAKTKQLSYRIRKLDPEVDLLLLLSPDEVVMAVTMLATLESFAIKDFQGRSLISGGKD